MPITFTASTYTYLWKEDLTRALSDIAAAGYDGAELMAAPPHVEFWLGLDSAIASIREACQRTRTEISSVVPAGLDVNLASPDGSMREWSVEHYIQVGRLAATVDARFLVIHPGRRHPFKPAPYEDARDWIIEGVSKVVTTLEDEGVRPVFENTPSGIIDSAEECVEIVEAVGAERIGICYDLANGFMIEDPADGMREVADKLDLLHVSDTTKATWLHAPIGTGEVDFRAIAEVIQELGYAGRIVAETIHGQDPGTGLREDLRALRGAGWGGQR